VRDQEEMKMTERLLRKGEVADRLGVSVLTVSRMIGRGELPVVKISLRAIRIAESAVRELVRSRTDPVGR
jgi:excisionase family DNA binding protein